MIIIILYLSGNFQQLSKFEKELVMAERVTKIGEGYHRLMTFYYLDDCNTILSVKRRLDENRQNGTKEQVSGS